MRRRQDHEELEVSRIPAGEERRAGGQADDLPVEVRSRSLKADRRADNAAQRLGGAAADGPLQHLPPDTLDLRLDAGGAGVADLSDGRSLAPGHLSPGPQTSVVIEPVVDLDVEVHGVHELPGNSFGAGLKRRQRLRRGAVDRGHGPHAAGGAASGEQADGGDDGESLHTGDQFGHRRSPFF